MRIRFELVAIRFIGEAIDHAFVLERDLRISLFRRAIEVRNGVVSFDSHPIIADVGVILLGGEREAREQCDEQKRERSCTKTKHHQTPYEIVTMF